MDPRFLCLFFLIFPEGAASGGASSMCCSSDILMELKLACRCAINEVPGVPSTSSEFFASKA